MAALLFLRGLPWKIIAPILAVLALLFAVYKAGEHSERGKWQKREAQAVEAQRAREAAMQAQVDAAGAALSMSTAEIERLTAAQRMNTRTYYVQNPSADVPCLTPERLRAVSESDKAAYASATASAGAK